MRLAIIFHYPIAAVSPVLWWLPMGDFLQIPLGDFAVIVSKPCIKKGGNIVSPPQLIHNTLKTSKKKRVKIFVFIKFLYLCLPKKWG